MTICSSASVLNSTQLRELLKQRLPLDEKALETRGGKFTTQEKRMRKPPKARILPGLWTFPVSGGMALAALFLRKFVNLPVGDITAWSNSMASTSYLTAQYLYILAYVILFFGFWAMYRVLEEKQKERLAFWWFMGALLWTSLALTTLGVLAYVSPVVGRRYLQGNTQLPQLINEITLGPAAWAQRTPAPCSAPPPSQASFYPC